MWVSKSLPWQCSFGWPTYAQPRNPNPKTSYPNVLLGNTPPHFQILDIIISFPQLSIMPFSHCPIQQIQMYKNKWDFFCDLSFFNLHFCIFFVCPRTILLFHESMNKKNVEKYRFKGKDIFFLKKWCAFKVRHWSIYQMKFNLIVFVNNFFNYQNILWVKL